MENSWEPLWKKWRRNEWRGWAWFIAIVGPPLGIIGCLIGLDADFRIRDAKQMLLGVMGLTQSVFAILYLTRRASWITAAIAGGVWLAWAVIAAIEIQTVENVGWFLGRISGSLLWAGLALSYFYGSVFGQHAKPTSPE